MNFSYRILSLDGCSEKLFPKQERERTSLSPSSLSRVDVFNNNINCLQKTYSFLTSEQLLVSAFLRGFTASCWDDFTEASYSNAQRGGDAGGGTWAVLGLRMLCQCFL